MVLKRGRRHAACRPSPPPRFRQLLAAGTGRPGARGQGRGSCGEKGSPMHVQSAASPGPCQASLCLRLSQASAHLLMARPSASRTIGMPTTCSRGAKPRGMSHWGQARKSIGSHAMSQGAHPESVGALACAASGAEVAPSQPPLAALPWAPGCRHPHGTRAAQPAEACACPAPLASTATRPANASVATHSTPTLTCPP